MTQIDFYTRVEDRLRTACRIAAKARARGLRVTLYCPDREAASRLALAAPLFVAFLAVSTLTRLGLAVFNGDTTLFERSVTEQDAAAQVLAVLDPPRGAPA